VFGRADRILKIVQAGDPVLRQRARPLTAEEIRSREIQDLIRDMRATMRKAPGVGLAAPQIGQSIRLFVVEDPEEFQHKLSEAQRRRFERRAVSFHVVINPVLEIVDEAPRDFFEGCLSVGDFRALVRRARAVRVSGLDEKAEPVELRAEGWHARILQHEFDHLEGTLCVDRMEPRSFSTTENYGRHWSDLEAAEVRLALHIPPP
jgi:peptide deformylase